MFLNCVVTIFVSLTVTGENVLANDVIIDETLENPFEGKTYSKCYEQLGCVEVNDLWYHEEHRPVNMEPMERHIINTDFLILKSDNYDGVIFEKIVAKQHAILDAGYQSDSNVLIVIHDFTSNGYTDWVKHLGSVVMAETSMNVIAIDWKEGAKPPFDQAVANARVVALEIVLFVDILMKIGTPLDAIELVGHGVGAHIAGYVGQMHRGIMKITGLDPTGPRFEFMADLVRLSPLWAKYVEVLHTDYYASYSQGTIQQMGHADIYINGPKAQAGCIEDKYRSVLDLTSGDDEKALPACSHKRSIDFFTEAVEYKDCKFIGIGCKNYEDYSTGKCGTCELNTGESICVTIGLMADHAVNNNISFYMDTARSSPFCLVPYNVTIDVRGDKTHIGYFDISIQEDTGAKINLTFVDKKPKSKKISDHEHNTNLYYAPPPIITALKGATITWHEKKSLLCFFGGCDMAILLSRISIYPISKVESCPVVLKGSKSVVKIRNGSSARFTARSGGQLRRTKRKKKSQEY